MPGWGGTFQKEDFDPLWNEVAERLMKFAPAIAARIDLITTELFQAGKKIYPNPSVYTAGTALALRVPKKLIVCLFIIGRLTAWARLAAEYL